MTRWSLAAIALVVGASFGCASGEDVAPAAEVAVCADLRAQENELIQVANEALSALAGAEDDEGRAAALAAGYDRLVDALAAQEPVVVPDAPALTDRLAAGHAAAVESLAGERDRFAAEVRSVAKSDERGRAGELQNALEKAFSELEPPRSAYVDAALAEAIDADPGCRHVTQRGDPAR